MILQVEHTISFQYSDFVRESWMELRIEPKQTDYQQVHSFVLAVGPPTKVFEHRDWLGNSVHHFGIPNFHERIEIAARSIVESTKPHPTIDEIVPGFPAEPSSGRFRDFLTLGGPIADDAIVHEFAAAAKTGPKPSVSEIVVATADLLKSELTYKPTVTSYHSAITEALSHRAGVCQDFAQIMIAVLRIKGVASRYVSGYLHVERNQGRNSESHAWVEYLDPTGAWQAYDPTNHCSPDQKYVVVAHGRNYDDVPPNKGVYRGSATESLSATVHTTPTERPDVAGLREQIESIDVPVYSKLPIKSSAPMDNMVPVEAQQQQQQ